jgi:hypothetical protein
MYLHIYSRVLFLYNYLANAIKIVTYFSKLNLLLKRHLFPIPNIGDIFGSIEGFYFASNLQLIMGCFLIL